MGITTWLGPGPRRRLAGQPVMRGGYGLVDGRYRPEHRWRPWLAATLVALFGCDLRVTGFNAERELVGPGPRGWRHVPDSHRWRIARMWRPSRWSSRRSGRASFV